MVRRLKMKEIGDVKDGEHVRHEEVGGVDIVLAK